MATPVTLSLVVDEKGALAGMDRFRTGAKASLASVSADVKNFGTDAQQVGAKVEAVGPKAQNAFRGIESSVMRARIAERLLISDLGIEMPGVLAKVIAKSEALGPILAGAFSLTIFTTAISALGGIGNKIAEVAQAMGGYTEEVKKMEQETIQASRQAFLSPETVDLTFKHLQEVNNRVDELKKKQEALKDIQQKALTENPFAQDSGYKEDTSLTEQENQLLTERNKLEKDRVDLQTQQTALNDHLNQQTKDLVANADAQAASAGLQGFAKIASDKAGAIEGIRKALGSNQGVLAQVLADNEKTFGAQSIALARQSTQATLALRHQVVDETLSGEQKIREDEKFSIQELDSLRRQSLITRQDYEQRAVLIHQQATNKLKALDLEVVKIQQDADNFVQQLQIQSLTGEERLYAERNLKIKELEDEKGRTIAEANGQATDKVIAQIFTLSQKEVAITKATEEQITALRKDEAQKRTLLLDQTAEQIRDAETAAALATVPPWQRAYAQIEVESNKRLQQIDKEERNQLAKYKQGSDEYVAITKVAEAQREQVHAETDEKVIAENKRMTDQLGSELESVFNDIGSGNIGKRILDNMKKLFFQILAQWILSLGQMKTGAGSILGSLIFGPGSTGANVFGGGGSGAGGGLGGLLGGLFGGSTSATAGTAGQGAISSTGQLFGTSQGNIFGAGTSTAAAATNNGSLNIANALGLGGLFGPSSSTSSFLLPGGPLNTQSIASTLGQVSQPASSALSPGGGLAGLKQILTGGGGIASLASLASLIPGLLGTQGGSVGQIGGLISSLGLLSGNPIIAAAGFDLLGFGIGQQHGKLAGGAVGAFFGGALGAILGIFGGIFGGNKRKKQANSFTDGTVLPDIKKIVDAYEGFQLDFAGANKQLDDLDTQAKAELGKLKSEGKSVLRKRVEPAIADAKNQIKKDEDERQRRGGLVFGPPQFHEGGFVSSAFSSFVNRPGELMAVLKHGEFVVNPQSTSRNMQTLERINSGGSITGDMHFYAPLIQAQRVDEAWLRNGGAQQILDALRRARYEGMR